MPTLTANQGEGGHNVCLIHTDDGRIRKMTPRECFTTQGFLATFKLPINKIIQTGWEFSLCLIDENQSIKQRENYKSIC